MKVLAIIPARGGSKGIPRKNVRLMNGKPLIAYAIQHAKECERITDVAVSTDDEEITALAGHYGVPVVLRGEELSADAVTLDPVIYDAVLKMEAKNGCRYDVVITLQATSPLLSPETLSGALDRFLEDDADTYISATNAPHLAWSKNENGYYPLYEKRLNRQQLPPHYQEAGAFFITKREFVTQNSRMGKKISVYEIPEREATDIDTVNDWIVCESQLKQKKVVFRCDGYKELGMGHVYRCLTLAYSLMGHEVLFVTRSDRTPGLEKIKASFFPCRTIARDEEFFDVLKEEKPDVIVNDCLDTSKEYIQTLKTLAPRVVTFEDLGEGAALADATINALYETPDTRENQYSGEKYIVLRDEFVLADPIAIREKVSNVFVMFGGTDPSNLTQRVYRLAQKYADVPDLTFTFVAGVSYDCAAHGIMDAKNIRVYQEVKRVTDLMKQADMAFTSQGRTVFELASMGVPSIVLAQNSREQLHTFAQMQNGFLNLGLGSEVHDDTIEKTFEWLRSTYEIRKDMSRLMQQHDLKSGIKRIKKIFLGE